jgi:heat shock protein HtpX
MSTLYTQQSSNVFKTWILMSVFFGIVLGIGWGLSWYMGNSYILYGAILIALIMNVYSYWYSDRVVVKMTGAKEADLKEYQNLHRTVENLAITAGLLKPRVYIIEDPAPNAFATGRDQKNAVVAVTTGLLSLLNQTELEGVLAHELSHIGNRDMLVATVAVVLVGIIAVIADFFQHMLIFGDNRERPGGWWGIVIGIIAAILVPIVAMLIQLAISRKREYLADASAALLTRYPEGLASALEKIQNYARPMKKNSTATAHLFIANPLGVSGGIQKYFSGLFSTHPPTEKRISALLEGQK